MSQRIPCRRAGQDALWNITGSHNKSHLLARRCIKKTTRKKIWCEEKLTQDTAKKKLPKQLRGEKNQKGVASTDHQAYVFLSAATLIHIDPEDLSNYAVRKSNLAEV